MALLLEKKADLDLKNKDGLHAARTLDYRGMALTEEDVRDALTAMTSMEGVVEELWIEKNEGFDWHRHMGDIPGKGTVHFVTMAESGMIGHTAFHDGRPSEIAAIDSNVQDIFDKSGDKEGRDKEEHKQAADEHSEEQVMHLSDTYLTG